MAKRKRGRGWESTDAPIPLEAAAEQAAWERDWPKPVRGRGPLNSFKLSIYRIDGGDVLVPVVDGVPLHEMLGDRWPGIPVDWIRRPSRQWLGAPKEVEYGRPVVLDGSCGIAGCCGVVARISVLSDTVIWDQFYGHGGPGVPDDVRFEFARTAYETQLANWPNLPVSEFEFAPEEDT